MILDPDLTEHPRMLALLDQFRRIDPGMRDLPIYNDKIAIEAVGFRPFGESDLLGIVITPWFMNLVLLPIEPAPMAMAEIGKPFTVQLPGGARLFVVGGNDGIGLYKSHSLHSPVLNFILPGQAAAEARRLLTLLMAVPTEEPPPPSLPVGGLDRRALLFPRRNNGA